MWNELTRRIDGLYELPVIRVFNRPRSFVDQQGQSVSSQVFSDAQTLAAHGVFTAVYSATWDSATEVGIIGNPTFNGSTVNYPVTVVDRPADVLRNYFQEIVKGIRKERVGGHIVRTIGGNPYVFASDGDSPFLVSGAYSKMVATSAPSREWTVLNVTTGKKERITISFADFEAMAIAMDAFIDASYAREDVLRQALNDAVTAADIRTIGDTIRTGWPLTAQEILNP